MGRPFARVNPAQIQQVLINLLINARQAMPEGGVVNLRLTADATGHLAELSVIDHGIGIAPGNLSASSSLSSRPRPAPTPRAWAAPALACRFAAISSRPTTAACAPRAAWARARRSRFCFPPALPPPKPPCGPERREQRNLRLRYGSRSPATNHVTTGEVTRGTKHLLIRSHVVDGLEHSRASRGASSCPAGTRYSTGLLPSTRARTHAAAWSTWRGARHSGHHGPVPFRSAPGKRPRTGGSNPQTAVQRPAHLWPSRSGPAGRPVHAHAKRSRHCLITKQGRSSRSTRSTTFETPPLRNVPETTSLFSRNMLSSPPLGAKQGGGQHGRLCTGNRTEDEAAL